MATITHTPNHTMVDRTAALVVAAVGLLALIAAAASSGFGETTTIDTNVPQSYIEIQRDFAGPLGTSFESR